MCYVFTGLLVDPEVMIEDLFPYISFSFKSGIQIAIHLSVLMFDYCSLHLFQIYLTAHFDSSNVLLVTK